ncbi:MAG: outer membrane protein transport protein [Proteobacteria bacterium]|nr:outer membrane protein transport protein [Pseudomonadota bacterium]
MRNKGKVIFAGLGLLSGLVFSFSRAQADTFDVYGCGARGMAMGNSLLTLADDPCAFYYNPARAPMIDQYFLVGYNGVWDQLYIDTQNPETKPSGDIPNTHGVVVGLASGLGIPKFRLGAVIYSPVNRLQLQHSFYTDASEYFMTNRLYFSLIGDVTQVQTIIVGGGYQLFPSFSLGLGFSVSIATHLVEPVYYPNMVKVFSQDKGGMEDMYLSMNSYQTNDISPVLGLYFRASQMIRLGVSYRGATVFPIKGEARVRIRLGDLELPENRDDYFTQKIDTYLFYSPDKIAGSVGLVLSPTLNLELGIDWFRWSGYRNTQNIGMSLADDPPVRDSANLRIGVEKQDEKERRFWAGIIYAPSPVPAQIRRQNLVDNDRVAFSFGVGYPVSFWGITIRGDVGCQWQHLIRREVNKIDIDTPGARDYLDADPSTENIENPGYPGYTSGGNLIAVQTTVNYNF